MEATAKHDFQPKGDGGTELTFKQGDKMLILNYGDQVQWYDAEMDGRRGLVPGNYIELEPSSWYMGRIPRAAAEQMLQSNKKEGAFLVRLSESSPSEFSLSVKCANAVQHFRILKDKENKYFLWTTTFNSLNELVRHYRRESVSRHSEIKLCDMHYEEQFVVEALYDFLPDDEAELGFRKGDLITVFDSTDENWWGGRLGDRDGYFPCSYVKAYGPNFQTNT